jgi:hypothetical protein
MRINEKGQYSTDQDPHKREKPTYKEGGTQIHSSTYEKQTLFSIQHSIALCSFNYCEKNILTLNSPPRL